MILRSFTEGLSTFAVPLLCFGSSAFPEREKRYLSADNVSVANYLFVHT